MYWLLESLSGSGALAAPFQVSATFASCPDLIFRDRHWIMAASLCRNKRSPTAPAHPTDHQTTKPLMYSPRHSPFKICLQGEVKVNFVKGNLQPEFSGEKKFPWRHLFMEEFGCRMRRWTLGFSCSALDKLQCCQCSNIYCWAGYSMLLWRWCVHLPWLKCTSYVPGTVTKRPYCTLCSLGGILVFLPNTSTGWQGGWGQMHTSSSKWVNVQFS